MCATSGKPFFGICVGMQLMAERGHEKEVIEGLGWIAGEVRSHPSVRSGAENAAYGLEHACGTNGRIRCSTACRSATAACMPISCIPISSRPADPADLVAQAEYGGPVTAIVGRDNMVGTQFHPEKSQKLGLALIANFLKWKP